MEGGREEIRVLWKGLALTYFLLLRVSELFAEAAGKYHEIYFVRRGDVAFCRETFSWEERIDMRQIRWRYT